MIKTDDEKLLLAMQRGEHAAMENFYRSYSPYLFAVANRYLADREDSRDVLQESFIRIFSEIKNFKPKDKTSLKAWATRIVVNHALNFLRNQRMTFVSIEEVDVGEIPDESFDANRLSAETIQKLIEELPSGYRTVFNLFAIEQMSHKEIAAMLGITESTSSSQYLRARRMLQQKIKNHLNE